MKNIFFKNMNSMVSKILQFLLYNYFHWRRKKFNCIETATLDLGTLLQFLFLSNFYICLRKFVVLKHSRKCNEESYKPRITGKI